MKKTIRPQKLTNKPPKIIFDDNAVKVSLWPLTATRNAADIRVGILTIKEKWELFFTRLIPFFEMGLFIKNDSVLKLFLNGHTADIPILKLIFKLPTSPYFNILRTPAVPLLRELKLENLIQSQKACGLLIRLDQNEYIVLFTEVADPWLRLRCENLQKSLIQHDYY